MTGRLRAFIAVELPAAVTDELRRAIAHLRRAEIPNLRTVRPDGVHLTLKFLGDIPSTRVAPVSEALAEVCRAVQPFNIHLAGTGAFPNTRRPRVLWAGVGGRLEPLRELRQSIEDALEELGLERETRPFNPHLTLARVRGGASAEDGETLARALPEIGLDENLGIPVNSVSLIRSTLAPSGAVYDRLASAPLRA